MAYIIVDGSPVARTAAAAEAGDCKYGFEKAAEAINANRQWNLVNARNGKISNAVKWEGWERTNNTILPFATQINPGEFFVDSWLHSHIR